MPFNSCRKDVERIALTRQEIRPTKFQQMLDCETRAKEHLLVVSKKTDCRLVPARVEIKTTLLPIAGADPGPDPGELWQTKEVPLAQTVDRHRVAPV
jgi:hypothetical protein